MTVSSVKFSLKRLTIYMVQGTSLPNSMDPDSGKGFISYISYISVRSKVRKDLSLRYLLINSVNRKETHGIPILPIKTLRSSMCKNIVSVDW